MNVRLAKSPRRGKRLSVCFNSGIGRSPPLGRYARSNNQSGKHARFSPCGLNAKKPGGRSCNRLPGFKAHRSINAKDATAYLVFVAECELQGAMPTLVVGMWRINPRFHHAHDSLGMALVFPQQKLFGLKVPPQTSSVESFMWGRGWNGCRRGNYHPCPAGVLLHRVGRSDHRRQRRRESGFGLRSRGLNRGRSGCDRLAALDRNRRA